jgi:hypothetical protein
VDRSVIQIIGVAVRKPRFGLDKSAKTARKPGHAVGEVFIRDSGCNEGAHSRTQFVDVFRLEGCGEVISKLRGTGLGEFVGNVGGGEAAPAHLVAPDPFAPPQDRERRPDSANRWIRRQE